MGIGRVKDRLTARFRAERDRRPWFDHLVRAFTRYQENEGDHFAAALTYFSFLALFPLLLLGLSVAGFVLASDPALLDELKQAITENIPGDLGDTLVDAVDEAIASRGTVGLVGLLGVLYAGLGWVGNLRTAVQVVWRVEDNRPYLKKKLGELIVLIGLGIAVLVSLGLTLAGTALTGVLLDLTDLEDVTGAGVVTRVLGLLFAVVGDTLVFSWMFVRLPRRRVPYSSVVKGALFAAVGFGALKVLGAVYAQIVSQSPTAGIFGNVIGLLVWLNLVARFLLYSAAWTVTEEDARVSSRSTG